MPLVNVMNKNTNVFDVELDDYGRFIGLGDVKNEQLMPIPLQDGNYREDKVKAWMESRLVPQNRIGFREAMEAFSPTVRRRNMFSLSDQYWFRWTNKETWSKGNFFTNPYFTDFGKMSFTPWDVNEDHLRKETPDQTTNGVLKKRWIYDEATGVSTLIKMGNREAHQEPVSEILASMTLQQIGILPFVRYELTVDGLKLCCSCRNFVTADTEFVPASQVYHKKKRDKEKASVRDHLLSMIREYAPRVKNPEQYLDRMAAVDEFIANDDRSLGNFGFIRSALNGEILEFAPLFDSGSCYGLGEYGEERKSRLFTRKEIDAAVKRVASSDGKRILASLKESPLLDFVDSYPTLTTEEKEYLERQIREAYRQMRNRLKPPAAPTEIMELHC